MLLAALGSIVEKLAPEEKSVTRGVLVAVALIGFGLATWGAIRQDQSVKKQQADTAAAEAATAQREKQLFDQLRASLNAENVEAKLGVIEQDLQQLLPKPPAIRMENPKGLSPVQSAGPAEQYFVQIAADTSQARLQPYVEKLRKKFNITDDFVGIVRIPNSSAPYRLAFGQHLNKPDADKYAQLANSLNLSPPGQSAMVERQP